MSLTSLRIHLRISLTLSSASYKLRRIKLATFQVFHPWNDEFYLKESHAWDCVNFCWNSLPEFVDLHRMIGHVSEVQTLEPFGVAVEVVTLYARGRLLEADVVEPSKAGTVDILDGVVRHKKVFFPSHKHIIRLLELFVVKTIRIEVLCILVEGQEFALKMIIMKKRTCDFMKPTQCFLSTSSSASHFLVRKGCFSLMISPSKNVTISGYSSVRFLIFR